MKFVSTDIMNAMKLELETLKTTFLWNWQKLIENACLLISTQDAELEELVIIFGNFLKITR